MAIKYDLLTDYRDINLLSRNQLEQVRRIYAKRFNQRLVEAARKGRGVNGHNPYEINGTAVNYLNSIGKKRFPESKNSISKISTEVLKQEVWLLTNALNSKMTTVTGRKEVFKSVQKTFRKDKKVKLDSESMDKFLKLLPVVKDSAKINYNIFINAVSELSQKMEDIDEHNQSEMVDGIFNMFSESSNPSELTRKLKKKYPSINSKDLRKALSKW